MDKEILLKFLKCKTTPEEEAAVLNWLDEDDSHRRELDALSAVFSAMVLHSPVRQEKPVRQPLYRRIARRAMSAAAMIAVGLGIGWYISEQKVESLSHQMLAVEVPNGHRMNMTLPDGTQICLNAGSRLEYPSVFADDERHVRLSGEAVFDVAKDEERPFTVNTYACDVKVLGTKFCVNVDEENNRFSTLLMHGCVKIKHPMTGEEDIIMAPKDYVKLEGNRMRRYKVDNFDSFLWTDGIISLKDTSFEELMLRFEKAYDIRIVVERKQLPRLLCRGKIRITDGIEHAMTILQLGTDLKYEYNADDAVLTIK